MEFFLQRIPDTVLRTVDFLVRKVPFNGSIDDPVAATLSACFGMCEFVDQSNLFNPGAADITDDLKEVVGFEAFRASLFSGNPEAEILVTCRVFAERLELDNRLVLPI